jgi:nucleoid-associated protein YgaU
MQRDFKIGMLLGIVLIIIGPFWLIFRSRLIPQTGITNPSASLRACPEPVEGIEFKNVGSPQTNPDLPYSPPKAVLSKQIRDNKQLSTINYQTKRADLTAYNQSQFVNTPKIHVVSKGETLSTISAKYYGSTNKWLKIFEANRSLLKDANKLRPGIKLIIPE